MAIERTFSILKPDATARNLTGAVNAIIEKAGLRIVQTFYGRWAGREDDGLIGQDVIIAELPG